jgi:hypothetical protein
VVPLVAIYAFIIFAFTTGSLIKNNQKIIPKLLMSLFVSGILVIVFFYTGLPEPIGKTEGSTLGNSSHVGGFMIFAVSFGIALLFYLKKWWQRIPIILGLLFITLNPLFVNKEFLLGNIGLKQAIENPTGLLGIANGGAMGIGLSIIFAGILFLVFSRKKILKIIGLILSLSLVLGVAYTSMALVKEGTKINKIFTEEKTGNRFIAWDIAQKGYNENPVWGNGVSNYIYNFEKFYNPDLYKKEYSIEKLLEPHNVVWQFASEGGAVGLGGYLLFLVGLFITLLYHKTEKFREDKTLKNMRIILAATLFGYFLQNLFVFDTVNSYLALFVIASIGLGVGEEFEFPFVFRNKLYQNIKKFFIIILIGGLFFLVWKLGYNGMIESRGMNLTSGTKNMSEFAKTREGLDEKSPFGSLMEYSHQAEKLFSLYQKIVYRIDEENKQVFLNEIDSLVTNLEKITQTQPYYSGSYLVMSELLNLYLLTDSKEGDFIMIYKNKYDKDIWNKSYSYITKAVELNKRNPPNYLVLAQLYMIKGDMDNAYLYAKEYINLAPEHEEGYSFSKSLLKIKPNKAFEEYVNGMEQKYLR